MTEEEIIKYHVRVGAPGEPIREEVLKRFKDDVTEWLEDEKKRIIVTPHDVMITAYNTEAGGDKK